MAASLRRYQGMIFATLFLGYACYGYNRKSITFVLPELLTSGLRKDEAGAVLSSQNLAYAGSKLLFGVLSDRVSSRLLFASGLLLSAAFTIVLAAIASVSVKVFAVLWFLNGCAQGCGWPSLIKVLQQWFLQAQFGTLYGVLAASANVSLSVAPFLSSYLMVTYNWRVSVGFTGAICAVLGALSLFTVVNKPSDVGLSVKESPRSSHAPTDSPARTGTAQNGAVARGQQEEELTGSAATTGTLLSSPFIWLLSASYLTMFFVRTGAADWGQIYIIEDLKQSQFAASAFMSCIEGGGFLGGITAGYVTDWMIVWRSSKGGAGGTSPRVPVSVVLVAGAAVAFHLFSNNVTQHTSELLISLIGLVMGGCLYGAMAIFGVVASECVPTHLSGTSHAIVAFGGSLGGVVSGFPLSLVAEHYGWSVVFLLLEVISFFTAVALFAGMNFDARVRAPQASNRDVVVHNAADKHDAPAMDALLVEPS
ncbi:glucose-6-phosphate exchanger SLC37A4 [Rhipicephalus microplus]|uniref:glucose-6-phosphate exchanger SLC37A4 n=1 Tax=Rhipicephalus microplus TaxID=6941 RepID=UPI003F6B59CE